MSDNALRQSKSVAVSGNSSEEEKTAVIIRRKEKGGDQYLALNC